MRYTIPGIIWYGLIDIVNGYCGVIFEISLENVLRKSLSPTSLK